MLRDFAAIDFETANGERTSICSVGAVIVRDGGIVDRFYSLVRPEPNYYAWFCRRVHGLSERDTCEAPLFPEVWRQLAPRLGELPLVAHNARFDEGCLRAVCACYGLDAPAAPFLDTLQASRRAFGRRLPDHRLHTVAAACGYDLTNHHHALADAEACAAIALRIL